LYVQGKEKSKLVPNFKTITDKSTESKFIPSGFIKRFVKEFKLHSKKPQFDRKDIYLSSKAGPHGPATLSSIRSIFYLGYYNLQRLFNLTDEAGANYLSEQFKFS
jgi:hypothetical protein